MAQRLAAAVQVADPKKLTAYVYNGDSYNSQTVTCAPATATVSTPSGTQPIGVLCRKIEQATLDANGSQGFSATVAGSPRTWSYTFSQYGQILTTDGPRTNVNDVTTTTYYDVANPDLGKRNNPATITDALGHVTQITAYDGNGRPLTLIDPNGLSTTLTYDARGRPHRQERRRGDYELPIRRRRPTDPHHLCRTAPISFTPTMQPTGSRPLPTASATASNTR